MKNNYLNIMTLSLSAFSTLLNNHYIIIHVQVGCLIQNGFSMRGNSRGLHQTAHLEELHDPGKQINFELFPFVEMAEKHGVCLLPWFLLVPGNTDTISRSTLSSVSIC